jgi:hypothetical protein
MPKHLHNVSLVTLSPGVLDHFGFRCDRTGGPVTPGPVAGVEGDMAATDAQSYVTVHWSTTVVICPAGVGSVT